MRIYNHKKSHELTSLIRETVFGVEDGMVSTLGSITGIAIGSSDRFTVLLAGIVIIAVESVSMGIGSYLSNRSSKEVEDDLISEEKKELAKYPTDEQKELYRMFVRDGWSKGFAKDMSKSASMDRSLMLKEMQYRGLGISPYTKESPIKDGIFMYFAYIAGGMLPLFAYFLFPITTAIPVSVTMTLLGLFFLGVGTTRYTHTPLIRSGMRTLLLGGVALIVGVFVGRLATQIR